MTGRILRTRAAVAYLNGGEEPDRSAPRAFGYDAILTAAKNGTIPVFDQDGRGYLFSTVALDRWLAGEWTPKAAA